MLGKTSLVITVLTLAANAGAAAFAQEPPSPPPPPGPGLALITERCASCHDTAQVFGARKSPPLWVATVQSMNDRGAELSPDEQKTVVAYLATNFAAPDEAVAPPSAASRPPAAPPHP